MTRLYDATHGQVQEFVKKLSIVGFTAEHMRQLMRSPHAMERWVRSLDTIMTEIIEPDSDESRDARVADVLASDGVLVSALKKAGMHSLSDIADWTRDELYDLRIIGKKRLDLVEAVLGEHGFTFSTHGPHDPDRVLDVDKSRAHPRRLVGDLKILEFIKFADHDFVDSFGRYRMELTVNDVRFMDDETLAQHFSPSAIHKIRTWIENNLS